MSEETPVLQVEHISKAFPGVQALDDVSLAVAQGEVHAVVGENGAGKSTLMKIIFGVHQPDQGQILISGRPVAIHSPADAIRNGVSIIFQELGLIPVLTVAENIFMTREPMVGPTPLIDSAAMNAATERLLQRVGLDCSPSLPVARLSVAQAQMVTLAKALSYNAKVIIMDEPTSSLTQHEAETLFGIIRSLKADGVSVIYISHRIEDLLEVADRVTVLRDGQVVGALTRDEASRDRLIQLMIGRKEEGAIGHRSAGAGAPLMQVEKATRGGKFKDISFTVHKGEILGLAGLVGAGRTELAHCLFGMDRLDAGSVLLAGRPVTIHSPVDAVRHGLGLVPEDRKRQGLILAMTVRENTTYPIINRLARHSLIDRRMERNLVAKYVQSLDIKTPSMEQRALLLSGGNQQKVVLAKWLAINPAILVLDEPTRGIDVGAKEEVHHLIRALADQGVGILLISSEIPEIVKLVDRALVMCRGRLAGEFSGGHLNERELLSAMLGD